MTVKAYGQAREGTCSAIIRFAPGGPEFHENAGHAVVGVTDVAITEDGQLQLWHPAPVGATVVHVSCQPDETLTERGVTFGPSGGIGTTIVRAVLTGSPPVRLDLTIPAHYAHVAGTYSNLWFRVIHDLSDVPPPPPEETV